MRFPKMGCCGISECVRRLVANSDNLTPGNANLLDPVFFVSSHQTSTLELQSIIRKQWLLVPPESSTERAFNALHQLLQALQSSMVATSPLPSVQANIPGEPELRKF